MDDTFTLETGRSGLPDTILVSGEPVLIYTDFRYWLKFGRMMLTPENWTFADLEYLFPEFPDNATPDILLELMAFYSNPGVLPRTAGDSGEEIIDYSIDAEYIYSAFMHAYGINLLDVDMHWHEFLALIRGLMVQLTDIVQYRSYDGKSETQEQVYKRLKEAWRLPTRYTKEEQQKIDEFNSIF